jgi:hypothetical protein
MRWRHPTPGGGIPRSSSKLTGDGDGARRRRSSASARSASAAAPPERAMPTAEDVNSRSEKLRFVDTTILCCCFQNHDAASSQGDAPRRASWASSRARRGTPRVRWRRRGRRFTPRARASIRCARRAATAIPGQRQTALAVQTPRPPLSRSDALSRANHRSNSSRSGARNVECARCKRKRR